MAGRNDRGRRREVVGRGWGGDARENQGNAIGLLLLDTGAGAAVRAASADKAPALVCGFVGGYWAARHVGQGDSERTCPVVAEFARIRVRSARILANSATLVSLPVLVELAAAQDGGLQRQQVA